MATIRPVLVARSVQAVNSRSYRFVNGPAVDEGVSKWGWFRCEGREREGDELAGNTVPRAPTRRCWGRFAAGEMKINDSAARN